MSCVLENKIMNMLYYPHMNKKLQEIKERCRKLRINQTSAEDILWKYLRNRQFHNLKFTRQHSIKFTFKQNINYFIADFYCYEQTLIIEIDGKIHEFQKEYDEMREHVLKGMGFHIVRFKNNDIEHDIEQVLLTLEKNIHF